MWGHEEGYHVVFVKGIMVVPILREAASDFAQTSRRLNLGF